MITAVPYCFDDRRIVIEIIKDTQFGCLFNRQESLFVPLVLSVRYVTDSKRKKTAPESGCIRCKAGALYQSFGPLPRRGKVRFAPTPFYSDEQFGRDPLRWARVRENEWSDLDCPGALSKYLRNKTVSRVLFYGKARNPACLVFMLTCSVLLTAV